MCTGKDRLHTHELYTFYCAYMQRFRYIRLSFIYVYVYIYNNIFVECCHLKRKRLVAHYNIYIYIVRKSSVNTNGVA